ncbi:MAG: class I SAM-dependent methyltransferase [Verrucomicrobiales bacterium]
MNTNGSEASDRLLGDLISDEIKRNGPMPLARFMELALYTPQLGYYCNPSLEVGRQGDFYTSVSVGSLFGQMLGFKFAQWLEALDLEGPLQIIESGAHNGDLAFDLLQFLSHFRPVLFQKLHYIIVEPLLSRRTMQEEKLQPFTEVVEWVGSLLEMDEKSINGLIISNELLDAMPVHQLRWNKSRQAWVEWGVGLNHGKLIWAELPAISTEKLSSYIPQFPPELLELLPDQFCHEVSLHAMEWWQCAAARLGKGLLFAADYGFDHLMFFHPQRTGGTLRAYQNHKQVKEILDAPGTMDITAHVNFTRIQEAGFAAGLRDALYCSQAQFLNEIFKEIVSANDLAFTWNSETVRQFQTLTHPEHLGRAFKTLAQQKG